uniref:EB domain-containing protein n=1 Tax=Ascaris lumbricoides TaxID=6252 RepID=A0A0M3ILU0_ASCLU
MNTQPGQSFPVDVPVIGGATGTSSTNAVCIDICMPPCTQQCVSQQPYAPSVIEGPSPITGGQPAIAIPQGTGSVLPQGLGSMMPPQNVPILPQGPTPVIPEGPGPAMVPSQYTTEQPLMSGPTVCFPVCMPTCNSQCIQQNTPQPTQAPIYVTPQPTYDPFTQTLTPATQQPPTLQCINVCMPMCSAQQQPALPLPDPVPIPPQLAPTPPQLPSLTPSQSQTMQCNPSIIGNECACPQGFVICVMLNGSNQCCRKR